MRIAIIAILALELIVMALLAVMVVRKRRWVKRQPGEFTGAIRTTRGMVDGLGPEWMRGSGRWVPDVIIWNKGPIMYRTRVFPVDVLWGVRPAHPGEVKGLGEQPVIAEFHSHSATIQIAVRLEDRPLVVAPQRAAPPAAAPPGGPEPSE